MCLEKQRLGGVDGGERDGVRNLNGSQYGTFLVGRHKLRQSTRSFNLVNGQTSHCRIMNALPIYKPYLLESHISHGNAKREISLLPRPLHPESISNNQTTPRLQHARVLVRLHNCSMPNTTLYNVVLLSGHQTSLIVLSP